MKAVVLLLAALVSIADVDAQQSDDSHSIKGPGATSCGDYVVRSNIEKIYEVWTQGFLSGLNTHLLVEQSLNRPSIATTDLVDSNGQLVWLRNYCEEHPLDSVYIAVTYLWVALREQQGLDPDPRFEMLAPR